MTGPWLLLWAALCLRERILIHASVGSVAVQAVTHHNCSPSSYDAPYRIYYVNLVEQANDTLQVWSE
jgi:hypothetical protein